MRIALRLSIFPLIAIETAPVLSATIRVPADHLTIQSAVNAAAAGDTVLVSCGIYPEHDIVLRAGVTVRSESGDPICATIDAQGNGRVLFADALTQETRVEGFTLTGGALAPFTGAVLCRASEMSFKRCLFADNLAPGLRAYDDCELALFDCHFLRNRSSGMRVTQSGARLDDCTFEENTFLGGFDGGAFSAVGSSVEFTRCDFARNSCGYLGGAIVALTNANVQVTECSFTEHSASDGGAIAVLFAQITITNSRFNGNTAGGGGALFCYDQASMTVTGSTFVGNVATGKGGGALVDRNSWLTVRNSTFFGNGAPDGGGLHQALGALTIENTIIAGGLQGGAFSCSQPVDPIIRCSDFHGNVGGNWISCATGLLGINGNVTADPLFCDPLAGDFRLGTASPCAPEHSGGCGLIGAWPVGCGATAVEPTTWGALKRSFAR